jgi:hypothetical protein
LGHTQPESHWGRRHTPAPPKAPQTVCSGGLTANQNDRQILSPARPGAPGRDNPGMGGRHNSGIHGRLNSGIDGRHHRNPQCRASRPTNSSPPSAAGLCSGSTGIPPFPTSLREKAVRSFRHDPYHATEFQKAIDAMCDQAVGWGAPNFANIWRDWRIMGVIEANRNITS